MKLLLTLLVTLTLTACGSEVGNGSMPDELMGVPTPITIVAIGQEGVLLVDGEGKLYAYHETYHISQILLSAGLKAGDVISDAPELGE